MGIYSPEVTKGAYTHLSSLSNDASDLSLLSHHRHDLFLGKGQGRRGEGGGGRGGVSISQDAETELSGMCPILASTHAVKRVISFSIRQREAVPSEVIGNLSDLSSGF